MTKKDYELIASAIKSSDIGTPLTDVGTAFQNARRTMASNIADALIKDNSRFDRDRFLKAAGV